MRIKTYQGGGIVYLPTVNQIGAAQNTAASSGSSDIEKVPGFTKEVISLIKENGLDSDVTVFLNKVQKTLVPHVTRVFLLVFFNLAFWHLWLV